jgi:hypothetical protein
MQHGAAWLHGSFLTLDHPTALRIQRTRWLFGIPSAAVVFRMRQASLASTLCPCAGRTAFPWGRRTTPSCTVGPPHNRSTVDKIQHGWVGWFGRDRTSTISWRTEFPAGTSTMGRYSNWLSRPPRHGNLLP